MTVPTAITIDTLTRRCKKAELQVRIHMRNARMWRSHGMLQRTRTCVAGARHYNHKLLRTRRELRSQEDER